MLVLINSVILLSIIGFAFGSFLAYAAKKFEVKEDYRTMLVTAVLPNLNCGACGFPGCDGFAKAFIKGEVRADGCLPGKSSGVPQKLTKIMKLSDEEIEKLFKENEEDPDKVKDLI